LTDVKMPQMGESIAEGTISVWLVDEGQAVKADEPLVTVSTDKADVDVPSPVSGVLTEIIAKQGETIQVGALIARIDEKSDTVGKEAQKPVSGEAEAGKAETPEAAKPEEAAPVPGAMKPVEGVSGAEIGKEVETAKVETAPPQETQEAKTTVEGTPPEMAIKRDGPAEHPARPEGIPAVEAKRETRPEEELIPPPEIKREVPEPEAVPESMADKSGFYSPAVMRLAMEHGVDLKAIKGTGEGGRVAKADVMRVLAEKKTGPEGTVSPERPTGPGGPVHAPEKDMPSPRIVQEELLESAPPPEIHAGYGVYKPPSYEVEEGDTELPFSRLRLLIADHMVYSKRTSAHVTTITEVDFEHIVGIRQRNKDKVKAEVGISLTYTPFVMAAAIRTLKEFPLMNSVVQGYAILTKRHINLGVAVDSERGLMVPVIKGAEDMSLLDLAKALHELSVRVRDKKITPDEMTGGTFTVTNPGRHGNLFGTPIISQPQVGILRMGELVKRAVVVTAEDGEDAIAIRPMMYVALSYDHRVVDGLTANEFLHRIKEHLEAGDFAL
jgi:pyruvate dehydrogenase E2 component (dihydrolipoamide acetyltransferase)